MDEGLTERLRKAATEKKVIKEEERGCGRKKGRSIDRKAGREEGSGRKTEVARREDGLAEG
jgi:hypothetical protein